MSNTIHIQQRISNDTQHKEINRSNTESAH